MLEPADTAALAAAVRVMKRSGKETQKLIGARTRAMTPMVRRELASRNKHRMDSRYTASGRVSATQSGLKIVVGSAGRYSSGLSVRDIARPLEFGANRNKVATYSSKSRRGKSYQMTRHVSRQLPWRRPKGRIAYPTLAYAAPIIVSGWVEAIMSTLDPVNMNGR